MIRVVIENILLFLLPTAIYVGYVLLTRRGDHHGGAVINDAPLVWLFIAGALLVVRTLVFYGSTPGGKPGQIYTPPRMKNGQIEPGRSNSCTRAWPLPRRPALDNADWLARPADPGACSRRLPRKDLRRARSAARCAMPCCGGR